MLINWWTFENNIFCSEEKKYLKKIIETNTTKNIYSTGFERKKQRR
jgi:hypothetical protein